MDGLAKPPITSSQTPTEPRTDISVLGGIGNITRQPAERAAQARAAFSLQWSRRLTPITCWTINNLHRGSQTERLGTVQRQPGQEEDGHAPSGARSKRLVNEISKLFYERKLPLITWNVCN